MRSHTVSLLAPLLVLLLQPVLASAQDPQPRHLTASLGLSQYELPDRGTTPMLAVRGTTPLSTVLVLEAGIAASRPELQFGSSTLLAPEAQVQLALPFNSFVPYMGLGAGAVMDLGGGRGSSFDMSLSGSLGARAWFRGRAGLQVEFRGRGIGIDFEGTTAEYSLGLAWKV